MKVTQVVIKKNAVPVDNIRKFAYEEDDYETILVDIPDEPPASGGGTDWDMMATAIRRGVDAV